MKRAIRGRFALTASTLALVAVLSSCSVTKDGSIGGREKTLAGSDVFSCGGKIVDGITSAVTGGNTRSKNAKKLSIRLCVSKEIIEFVESNKNINNSVNISKLKSLTTKSQEALLEGNDTNIIKTDNDLKNELSGTVKQLANKGFLTAKDKLTQIINMIA